MTIKNANRSKDKMTTNVPAKNKAAPPPAKVQEGAMPAFMQGKQGAGLEALDQGDYEVPRIQLIQAVSEQAQDGRAKPGDFWHTVLEEVLGDTLTIVPIYTSKAYILWRPRPPVDAGGILARADDGVNWSPANVEFEVKIDKKGNTAKWRTAPTVKESGLDQWGTFDPTDPKSQPAATYIINQVVILPDHPNIGPAVLSFQRSSVKPAKKFLGKLRLNPAPSYGRIFEVSSIDESGDSGNYKNFRIEARGHVQDEEDFKTYENWYNVFKKMGGVRVRDLDKLQDDENGSGGEAAESTKY